uniref:Integrin alpha FG-GAP repeat containing 1 n=1 Tax=Propithecus coquereli TaxID=379532 RepID=A0A2K6GQH1_PROCO
MAAACRLPWSWALLAPLLAGLALLGVGPVPARALHNVTGELFGAEAWGTLAAFGDLNSDKQTDLFVLRERNDLIVFLADQNAPYFKPKVKLSLGDGHMDHLLPGCEDKNCQKSTIYLVRSGTKQWVPVLQDFSNKGTLWGFVPFVHEQQPLEIPIPITLHIGDYNMDGYPDALAILKNTSGSNQQAFLLENVPCNNASCEEAHRMFKVYWELTDLNQIKDAMVATFFDIYEDGILDIVVLSKGYTKNDFVIHTLKNNFEADAYFVKVIVLSGLCSNDCPRKITPFGVNQPGPYIMYTTVDANGYLKNGSAGQLSQSAHLALQLPYSVLGLGRSANFLDHLYVGIPRPSGEKSIRKQEWTAIIPNSQLIVIPYPHNVPRSWSAKLYLTPSNIVLLTAIALIGVCVFILAIIGILHWQEKKADDREKRQEAHRFHFDAM